MSLTVRLLFAASNLALLFSLAEFSHGSQPSFERNKDRLSYSHQIFKVDLTQVKGASVRADERHFFAQCLIDVVRSDRARHALFALAHPSGSQPRSRCLS